MTRKHAIYHIISVLSFIMHIGVFLLVLVGSFLPYLDEQNFYKCFNGFFGETLSTIQPYILIAILFLTNVFAFLAIKRRLFALCVVVTTITFFVLATLPYSIEAMILGFASPWIGGSMRIYGIGFKLICIASYIFYFDIAFLIYSFFTWLDIKI